MRNCDRQRTCDNKGISSIHTFRTPFRSEIGSLYCGSIFDPPSNAKTPANLTACGTPGAAGNVTQTHDLLDTSLRMFVPVNLCGWMGYVAHPTPDSRELCNSCPASGVTFRPCLAGLHQAISIHAPAWGATCRRLFKRAPIM